MTECWFRNPHNYIRELVDCDENLIAWDRGLLVKKSIDPMRHVELYFGTGKDFRILMVGEQGTAELRPGYRPSEPFAVYPTWDAGADSFDILEEMVAYPVGDDPDCYNNEKIDKDVRPVMGQEHRVVLTNLPNMATGPGKNLIRKLNELQEEYPACIIHLHGLYSYRVMFGLSFQSVDVDPRSSAGSGKVYLPNGKEVIAERAVGSPQWLSLLGFTVGELRVGRNRCLYNIKSAKWASENYKESIKFKSKGEVAVSPDSPSPGIPTTAHPITLPITAGPGDKQLCNTCSLQDHCKYYREGAVCSIPGSEPAPLARLFKSRDSDTIIDGLGTVLALQTRRLERGVTDEELMGELDPEVSKIANQIFSNGAKLAKLLNPSLGGGARVQVNVGAGAVAASTPNQVMGAIVRELESRGIAREDITPDMVQNLLIEMGQKDAGGTHAAIESTVVRNVV